MSRDHGHLIDDELALENCQEMTRLLAHGHPDLNGSSVVLVVHGNSLIGTSCDLILGGVASLWYPMIHFSQACQRSVYTYSMHLQGCANWYTSQLSFIAVCTVHYGVSPIQYIEGHMTVS